MVPGQLALILGCWVCFLGQAVALVLEWEFLPLENLILDQGVVSWLHMYLLECNSYILLLLAGLEADEMCSPICDRVVCAASSIVAEGPNTQRCRCDSHCSFFQDCCEGVEPEISGCANLAETYSGTNRSLWSCQSLYLGTVNLTRYSPEQVGVYVVSTCPSTWLALSQELNLSMDEFGLVEDLCSTANSTLPPASDASSGRVYKNEYCALCHKVPEMSLWYQTVLCSNGILDTIRAESQLPLAVVKERCGPCVYVTPPSLYSNQTGEVYELPRSCTPVLSSCPEYPEFVLRAGSDWALSVHDYQQIVGICTQKTEYVQSFSDAYAGDVVYKNPYCVVCNTFMPSPAHQCFSFDLLRFPFCKSQSDPSGSGLEVKVVLDAAQQTVDVFGLSAGGSFFHGISLDVKCPSGQVFSFVTFECREASCSKFDLPTSGFTCTITGLSTGTGDQAECSEELVLDDPSLHFALDASTYYYVPLLATVFVSYTNAFGFPVVCLDSAVPTSLVLLRALNILTFVVTIPSMILLVCASFVYLVPSSMRTVYGMVVVNFAFASFLADLALLLGYSGVILTRSPSLCFAAGILDHFLALAQFYWLIVHTFDVGLRYYRRAKSIESNISLRILAAYYSTGWVLPIMATSFEVSFVYAVGGIGNSISCFQFSSFLLTFLLYLVPASVAIIGSLVAYPILLCLIGKTSFKLTKKDKFRLVVLSILLLIMSVSFVIRVAGLYITTNSADILVGFFHLPVVAVRSAYLAAVLLLKRKVPKAMRSICVSSKVKVASATAEEVELAELRCGEAIKGPAGEAILMNHELNRLANQLANPALETYREQ